MANDLVPMNDMKQMAQAVVASGLFGVKTLDQALALMLLAQAENMHPATAARDYHIVDGRPTLKADAMLARFLQSGGSVKWHEYTDAKVSATFSHPQGGSITVDWDDARIKQAGLSDRPNHRKYPRQMKRARVISEGIRTVNPGVAIGIYTPEEAEDFEEKKPRKERDMGPAEVVHEIKKAEPAQESGRTDGLSDGTAQPAQPLGLSDEDLVLSIGPMVKRKDFDGAYDLARSIRDEKIREDITAKISKAMAYVADKAKAA